MRAHHVRAARFKGQAITEFALVLPVMIVILLYSLYFFELVRAKLKLQEASRYVAWEMTSYALDNYGTANHGQAFDLARQATITDANKRYEDLESIDERSKGGIVVGYKNLKTTIANLEAPEFTNPLPAASGNAFIGSLLNVLNGGVSAAHRTFGFNTRGKVQVEVSMQLDNRLLPRRFLDKSQGGFFEVDVWGGRNLQDLNLKNRFTLVASGWALPDGADAEQHQKGLGSPRSGVHRGGSDSGLYTQVHRMHLLGAPSRLTSIPGLGSVLEVIGKFVPEPLLATYVVSHNYFADGDKAITDRGCDQDPSHGAQWGMNNLDANNGPGLDWDRRKCYDTAPFRDVSAYDASLYRKIYLARGAFFMGCKNAQADIPNAPGLDPYSGKDKHNKKYSCE